MRKIVFAAGLGVVAMALMSALIPLAEAGHAPAKAHGPAKAASKPVISRIGAFGAIPAPKQNSTIALRATPAGSVNTCVTLQGNQLCGIQSQSNANVVVFPGIQYAAAGRWQASTLAAPPGGNLQSFGPECPQAPPVNGNAPEMMEQCLYLNVWTPPAGTPKPAGASAYPVMVFIHGGAFISGSGSASLYDGSALAAQGVVVVTLNYRLGVLGFLNASGTPGGNTTPANLGLQDQQNAMLWVNKYIAAFGGNNQQVTIFGESAGAMSVALHLFDIPSSAGLFQNAIMESDPGAVTYQSPAVAQDVGSAFYAYVCQTYGNGSCTADWWNGTAPGTGLTSGQLVTAQTAFLSQYSGHKILGVKLSWEEYMVTQGWLGLRGLPWQPVFDNSFICGQPYQGYYNKQGTCTANGNAQPTMPTKPALIGMNQNEGALFPALDAYASAAAWNKNNPNSQKTAADEPSHDDFSGALDGGLVPPKSDYWVYQQTTNGGRYDPKNAANTGLAYYNGYGAALANVITDFTFGCADLQIATAAGSQAWLYYFSQPPAEDPYASVDTGACAANGPNVCHTAELPFVFGTLPAGASNGDTALSGNMVMAWAAFAGAATASNPWTGAAMAPAALNLNASQTFPSFNASLDPNAVCRSVWDASFWAGSNAARAVKTRTVKTKVVKKH